MVGGVVDGEKEISGDGVKGVETSARSPSFLNTYPPAKSQPINTCENTKTHQQPSSTSLQQQPLQQEFQTFLLEGDLLKKKKTGKGFQKRHVQLTALSLTYRHHISSTKYKLIHTQTIKSIRRLDPGFRFELRTIHGDTSEWQLPSESELQKWMEALMHVSFRVDVEQQLVQTLTNSYLSTHHANDHLFVRAILTKLLNMRMRVRMADREFVHTMNAKALSMTTTTSTHTTPTTQQQQPEVLAQQGMGDHEELFVAPSGLVRGGEAYEQIRREFMAECMSILEEAVVPSSLSLQQRKMDGGSGVVVRGRMGQYGNRQEFSDDESSSDEEN